MPASVSPTEMPEIGFECNEFAVLPGSCGDKDCDSFTFVQGPSAPTRFRKPESLLPSGATTPGEESSEIEDHSDYEFNADGQEDYYDFLREMGCDFKQTPDEEDEEEEEEYEEEGEKEWNENWVDDGISADHCSPAYIETVYAPICSPRDEVGVASQASEKDDFCFGSRFRSNVSIAPGPSLCLRKALSSVAAQRNREEIMERSWQMVC